MALIGKICILDYVPYDHDPNLDLEREDFMVPSSMRPYLETLQGLDVRLKYDGCKSQGLNIVNCGGEVVGHVPVFCRGREDWLGELQEDFQELARNPGRWGLVS